MSGFARADVFRDAANSRRVPPMKQCQLAEATRSAGQGNATHVPLKPKLQAFVFGPLSRGTPRLTHT
jgi:hypothetical protein